MGPDFVPLPFRRKRGARPETMLGQQPLARPGYGLDLDFHGFSLLWY